MKIFLLPLTLYYLVDINKNNELAFSFSFEKYFSVIKLIATINKT